MHAKNLEILFDFFFFKFSCVDCWYFVGSTHRLSETWKSKKHRSQFVNNSKKIHSRLKSVLIQTFRVNIVTSKRKAQRKRNEQKKKSTRTTKCS